MPVQRDDSNRPDGQQNQSRFRQFGGSILFLVVLLLLLNLIVFPNASPEYPEVSYSQFIEQVESDKVERATLGNERIRYELKDKATSEQQTDIYITRPIANDTELPQLLREHEVQFSAAEPDNTGWIVTLLGWVVPPLIFFGIWAWLFNRAQRGGGGGPAALQVGKSKARIYSEGDTGIKFEDVAGVDEAKAELQEVVDYLDNAQKYARLGAKIPKGVLLVGAPGTGKTLLAKAVAGEARVPFFSISGSEFIEMFVGVGASRVRDLFEQAKQQAPCIVFIDELDALGKSRGSSSPFAGGGNTEQEQTLNQLLNEMDGFDANTGAIVLAATNRPEVIDPALRRPGRFDRQIVVDRPDKKGREEILQVHARSVKLSEDVDFTTLAARTPGFAGADLANLVNEAALLAARAERDSVTMADFSEAIERVIAGLEKKSRVLNETEKTTVAYHEVGHAIIGSLMPGGGRVEKISIVPRGVGALGFTLQLPEEDRFLVAEDELRGRIATLLAGRSSEEVVFGKVSTGASDDIQKATDLAERCATIYGMSDKLGPIAFDKPQQQQYLPGMGSPRRSISPSVTEEIDRQVKATIDGAHHAALKILSHNRQVLEDISQALLDREVIEAEELQQLLERVELPEQVDEWLKTGQLPQDEPLMQNTLDSKPAIASHN